MDHATLAAASYPAGPEPPDTYAIVIHGFPTPDDAERVVSQMTLPHEGLALTWEIVLDGLS